MREIMFRVLSDRPGQLVAQTDVGSIDHSIQITAQSFEELRHEAREALIQHLGSAHSTYRVRLRRTGAGAAIWQLPVQIRPDAFIPCLPG